MLFDKRVLVVDDDAENIRTFELVLEKAGFEIIGATSGQEALKKVHETFFPIALLDVRMPGMNGVELLQKISQSSPETLIALVTAYGKPEAIEEAYKAKAFDFIDKPVDNNLLLLKVNSAYEQFLSRLKNDKFRREIMYRYPMEAIIYKSERMEQVLTLVRKVAETDETVLILGESGTGKELVARAIHWLSPRQKEVFKAISAPSFPETMLEDELFGHEKGAFTGAADQRIGYFETCTEGTLFLDEIGDIKERMQMNLLRVIQEKKITRLGSTKDIDVNTRIVLATNADLEERIEAGQFREDLYFRINPYSITIPPLRERKEDIPLLINFWLIGQDVTVSDEAFQVLCQYDFARNNIRELINILKKAFLLQDDGTIDLNHLPPEVTGKPGSDAELDELLNLKWKQARTEFEKRYLKELMERTNGHKTKAAELSGIDRTDLHRKLKRFGIKYQKNNNH